MVPLPAQPNALIGREREIAAGREMLLAGAVRLLTLTGPPGIGKTRLAAAIAGEVQPDLSGPIHFIDLSTLRDPDLVPPAIAGALHLPERLDRTALEQLETALVDADAVLVLDNFEQVLGAAPRLSELLSACPRLRLLVTSRERLNLTWEQEFPVPPLGLPDLSHLPSPDALAESPGVALFLERAHAVEPEFTLNVHNARATAELCVRLDGVPLAIELAAARVRILPPHALLLRLPQSLDFLSRGPRDRPGRHQTLRAAIAWSYDLLNRNDQTFFRRLGIFRGGFTEEAAAAVCLDPGSEEAVLDRLGSLVDKSLLHRDLRPAGFRFHPLEILREFALERLKETGELDAVSRQHTKVFMGLAERTPGELVKAEQGAWMERLEDEHENLRSAMESAAENDPEAGLRIATGLAPFWERRGLVAEGRRWLSVLLQQVSGSAELRARALNAAGNLARVQGDYAAARDNYLASLELVRALGDSRRMSVTLNNLGAIAKEQGEYKAAHGYYEESLALKRELGDRRGEATTLNNLGLLHYVQGNQAAARRTIEESLALFQEVGHGWGIALATNNLGRVAAAAGNLPRAQELLVAALTMRQTLGDRWGIAESLEGLARVARGRKDPERAARLQGAAEVLRAAHGFPISPDEVGAQDTELGRLRVELGTGFAPLIEAGRRLSLDDAVTLALESGSSRRRTGLTRREEEVVSLIAQGLSNREIAASLGITEGTAENHVQHILNKLGFSSRSQIAVWAAEHGLHRPGGSPSPPAYTS